ncbi:hypothetical protein AB0C29_25870, partial [Actinoplanes sp. NPDC048791]
MGASAGPAVPPSTRRRLGAGLVALLVVAAPALLQPAPAGAVAAAPVLLSDDFEDGDANGWRTTGGRWAVATDGTGVLQQSATDTRALARAGEAAWTDYSVSTRVRQLTGDTGSSTAVLARIQGDGSHYYLASRADDTVELGRVSGGRSTPLASASY